MNQIYNNKVILNSERNLSIDYLRCIGTLLIIFAHCNPPNILYQFRSFDVILLVFISGMMIKPIKKTTQYIEYVKGRIKKLIIPTYLLITIIVLLSFLICTLLGKKQLYSISDVIQSYLLFDGIGYVWIVRIYILIAVLAPLIIYINKIIRKDFWFCIIITMMLFADSIAVHYFGNELNFYIKYFIIDILPYIIIATIGYRLYSDGKNIVKFLIASFFQFIIIGVVLILLNKSILPSDYKYPPTIFYIMYGLSASILLYIICNKIKFENRINKYIEWVSIHSFTLYLVHIVVLFAYNMIEGILRISVIKLVLIKYLIIIILSILFTNIINKKIKEIINEYNKKH